MVCSILICMLHCSGALHKINKISQKANWKGQPDRWTRPGIDKGDTLTKEIIANLIVNLWGGGHWPIETQNSYISATDCPIDLKQGCKLKFVRCLQTYL